MKILIVLIIAILFYLLQSIIYSKNCFKKVGVSLKFSLNGIFEGEETELIQVISNKKLLPLWWVLSKFNVSRNIIFIEDTTKNEGNDNFRQDFFSILSYERVTKSLKVIGDKRGFYTIDQLDLHSGDLFGLNKIIASYKTKASLYVYPKLIAPLELNVNFRSLTGEILTKRNIVEDPFQLRGIREYHPFDSIKSVNWAATAKTGLLKVNEYDFTASQEVIVFLNVEKYNSWDSNFFVEEGIRLAASIITQYLKDGMKVGLKVNGCDSITGQQINLPPVSGINQNLNFYKSLARLDITKVSAPISTVIKQEQMKQNKVPLWVVVSHYFGPDLQDAITTSRAQGFDVKWILPKARDSKVEIEDHKDLFVWEVKDL
jgi:uncharacterized protein (DUF58 family)